MVKFSLRPIVRVSHQTFLQEFISACPSLSTGFPFPAVVHSSGTGLLVRSLLTCISQIDTLMPFVGSLSFYRSINKTPVHNTSIYPYPGGPSLYLSPLERFASSCLFPLLLELALQWQPNTEQYESAQGHCTT